MRMTLEELAVFARRGYRAQVAANELLAKLGTPKRKLRHPEDTLQRSLVKYWALAYPLSWAKTMHCPSGLMARHPKLAAIFKGLGWKRGFPDLACYERRGCYSGLALELKVEGRSMRHAQRDWMDRLTVEGWYCRVAWDFDRAREIIDSYHRLPPWRPWLVGEAP